MSLVGDVAEGCPGYQVSQSLSPLISPSSPDVYSSRGGGSPSPCTSPKRLSDSLILLHLPFNQHSKVEVKPGILARDAIAKILEKRAILPQMCRVCIGGDPSSPRIDLSMDLETLSNTLEKKELWVHSAYLSILVSIKHSFVRKTFLSVAFCDVCHKQIWLQGYRCELCQFTFHQKCGSKVPNYCDRMQQISHDVRMANKLRDICDQYEGPNAALVAEIIQHFQSLTADPLPNRMDISREHAVRLPGQPEISIGINESSRDRSSSAPNIYEITKDETLRETKMLDALSNNVHVLVQPSGTIRTTKPTSFSGLRDWQLTSNRRSNRLHPSTLVGMGSPSSTSSSPPPAYSGVTYDTNSGLPPTPPQSAPPQKTFGFRFRSKSPNDKIPIKGPGGRSSVSSDRLGESQEGDYKEKLKQRILMEGWEIDRSLVTYHKKIGSGSFGTVYLGSYFGKVAIKKLNVGEPSPAQLQAFKNEVGVLKKTRHANVLLFMGWMREPYLAIVTQWCEGSSLYRQIHVNEPRVDFEISSIIDICKQIAQGMNYLHSRHIIHRDLKTNNIFLTDDGTVKIGDFGLATVKTRWSGGQQNQQPTGSILWMAPEVIRMQDANPYTTLSDVYSFGICLFELLSGVLPYSHINSRDQILFMVGRGYLKPDLTKVRHDTPKGLLALLEKCIKFCRDERLEFEQVLIYLERASAGLPRLKRSVSEPQIYRSYYDQHDFLLPVQTSSSPKTNTAANFSLFTTYSWTDQL
ncbi:kinase domain protein [Onchocerca flexuosa]|uniref:Raf homolog serine/threonine-protein kinase n=1 Tax=Onchocerca flexuosa TaxID=387005 RepID=A0A238BUZ2_9BILA|nr:kinase domain protein [Onchocerca flexuosa]